MTGYTPKIVGLFVVCLFGVGCTRATPAPVTLYGTAAPELNDSLYRVQEDETVYSISRTTDVNMQALIDMNSLSPPFTILPGQMLKLPKPSTYKVQQDDTVFAISQAFNVSQSELVSENNLQAPNYKVSLGQILRIPTGYSPNQRSIFDDSISVDYEPAPAWNSASSTNTATSSSYVAPPSTTSWSGGAGVASQDLPPPPSAAGSSSYTPPQPAPSAVAQQPVQTASVQQPQQQSIVQKPVARSSSKFGWPVQGNVISSYGSKKSGQQNDGINIGVPRGTPVRAAENGVVAYSGNEIEGYGNLLLIRHSDGYMTAYAHLDKALVKRGDTITRGQTVASVGSSGNVTSPQLHFEIRQGSKSLNPEKYLN